MSAKNDLPALCAYRHHTYRAISLCSGNWFPLEQALILDSSYSLPIYRFPSLLFGWEQNGIQKQSLACEYFHRSLQVRLKEISIN